MFINPVHLLSLLEAKYNVDDDEENFGFSADDAEDGFAEDNNPYEDDEDSGEELKLHGDLGSGERDDGEDSAFDLAAENEAPMMTRSKRGYLVPALPTKPSRGSRKNAVADSGTSGKDNFTAMREGDAAKLYSAIQDEIMPVLGHFSGYDGLSDRAKDILTALYGYVDMFDPTAHVVQTLVYLSEQFGIECRKSGAEPYGNPGEPVITEADIVSLYYNTAPKSVYMARDPEAVAHIDLVEASKLASRISNNIAGRGDATEPAMPVPSTSAYATATGAAESEAEGCVDGVGPVKTATLYNYLSRSSKRRGKRRESASKNPAMPGAQSSLCGAQYLGETYPGDSHGRVFIGLYPVFDLAREQFKSKKSMASLLKNGTAEDLACDVLRQGTSGFTAEHPGVKFRGLSSASSPTFASYDPEGAKFVCGKSFIDCLNKYVIDLACPADPRAPVRCSIVKGDGKTRLRGEELKKFVAAFDTSNGESGATRKAVSVGIPYERVKEYVEGGYMYVDGKGLHPLFIYFKIMGSETGLVARGSSGSSDETEFDLSASEDVASRDMGEDVDSGNVVNDVLDNRIIEMLTDTPNNLRNIRMVTGETLKGTSHKQLWDALGLYLGILGRWMKDCGAKSTVELDGVGKRPRIHIDDSEVSSNGTYRLGEAWRRVYNAAAARWLDGKTVREGAPAGFREMNRVSGSIVWGFITEVARWFDTYSAEKWFDVDSLTAALYASPKYFDDVLKMITPDFDMRRLFGDYVMGDRDGILERGIEGVTVDGHPVDATAVAIALAMYCRRVDAEAGTGLFDQDSGGKLVIEMDFLNRLASYLYEKCGENKELMAEWASSESCPDVLSVQEWELLKAFMSGVETEAGEAPARQSITPPSETTKRFMDMNPYERYRGIVVTYMQGIPRVDKYRFISSLVYVAAEMADEERNTNTKDSFQRDNASALDETIPLDSLQAVFGQQAKTILAIAGHYCGDSGEALNVLASFVSRGEPAADEGEARPVAEAVDKLKDVDFLIFKTLTM